MQEKRTSAQGFRNGGQQDPAGRVALARYGNSGERDRLIEDYQPFVAGIVRRMLGGRYGDLDLQEIRRQDEFSVGLMAFNEAIDRYDPGTGVPFLSFAGLVVNRRMVDWFRSEARDRATSRFSELEEVDEAPLADRLPAPERDLLADMEAEEEILAFRKRLEDCGLSLFKVYRRFPRHRDSKRLCIRIARLLQTDRGMMTQLGETLRLPCAELSRRSGTPVKTIEKNRESIILVALLMDSGLDTIKGYLREYRED